MNTSSVLLSGTPASGKDTITEALAKLDSKFIHFRKHKIASGGKLDDSYILVSAGEFDAIKMSGGFIQSHERYGRGYGVSVEEFDRVRNNGQIPVIHVGKYENLQSFRSYGLTDAFSVLVFAERSVTQHRLIQRHGEHSSEIAQRLDAYNEEVVQLKNQMVADNYLDFDLAVINNGNDANVPARSIIEAIKNWPSVEETQDILKRLFRV